MKKMLFAFFVLLLSFNASLNADVYVRGYFRKNGTYVAPYHRTNPDRTEKNNYSYCNNINPYTGKIGTKDCYYDNN